MLCNLDVRQSRSRLPTPGGAAARRYGGDGARVLATNAAMLGLVKRLGFATIESPEGPTVCLVPHDLGTVA